MLLQDLIKWIQATHAAIKRKRELKELMLQGMETLAGENRNAVANELIRHGMVSLSQEERLKIWLIRSETNLRKSRYVILTLTAIIVGAFAQYMHQTRAREYQSIPNFYHGVWTETEDSPITGVRISDRKITISHEEHPSDICNVQDVEISDVDLLFYPARVIRVNCGHLNPSRVVSFNEIWETDITADQTSWAIKLVLPFTGAFGEANKDLYFDAKMYEEIEPDLAILHATGERLFRKSAIE